MIATRFNPLGRAKPYAYEVEYLESTGTQYIDTGVRGYFTWEITAQGTKESSASQVVLSSHSTGGSFLGAYSSTNKWGIGAPDNGLTDVDYLQKKDFVFRCVAVNPSVTVDGKTFVCSNKPDIYRTFKLFAVFSAPQTIRFPSCARIFKAKAFSEDEELIVDLVPVVDFSGVACMYDKVSQQLLYNQGTGEFTAGARI